MRKYLTLLAAGTFAAALSLVTPVFTANVLAAEEPAMKENTTETSAEYTIVIATDLHLLSPDLKDNGSNLMALIEHSDGKVVHYSPEITDAFIEEMLDMKPDCVLLTGDLTFNGETGSHKYLAKELHRLTDEGINVYVIPGNHDLSNSMARRYSGKYRYNTDSPDAAQFKEIYKDFGYGEHVIQDPNSLSYVQELAEDLWLLNVDVNTAGSPGILTQETLDWTENVLKKAAKLHIRVIASSHQNLLKHNKIFFDGFMMGNAQALQKLYAKYGVTLNLSGHMHMQHIASKDGVTEVATSSLAVTPCQYGVLKINHQDWSYQTQPLSLNGWAKVHLQSGSLPSVENLDLSEPETEATAVTPESELAPEPAADLVDFEQYVADFFDYCSRFKIKADLDEYKIPAETLLKMQEEAVLLNRSYFSGRMDTISNAKEQMTNWQKYAGKSFMLIYLLSIVDETTSMCQVNGTF